MYTLHKHVPSLACLILLTTTWLATAAGQSKVVLEASHGKHRLILGLRQRDGR